MDAARLAQIALGKTVRIRLDHRTSVLGIIFYVKVDSWREVGDKKKATYQIKMKCGTAGAIRTFLVTKLPVTSRYIVEIKGEECS